MSIGTQIESPQWKAENQTPISWRVSIVGCGPRGLYCLERVLHLLQTTESKAKVIVDVFEPARFPGAGFIYDPNQPHHLRMNFANKYIDARHPGQRESSPTQATYTISKSFMDWARRHHPTLADPDSYSPRSIVGEYLFDCFTEVVRGLKRVATVNIHRTKADDIQRTGSKWKIIADGQEFLSDEVAVTVGHEGWRSTDTYRTGEVMADIPSVFPVEQALKESAIPSGTAVAIRGFGLTWIDAALSLTEGRGGTFTCENGHWRYARSGREPHQLLPFSRSGRPYLAKPFPSSRDVAVSQIMGDWADKLMALRKTSDARQSSLDFRQQVWPLLVRAAQTALDETSDTPKHLSVQDWFRGWSRWRISGAKVVELQRQSYEVAIGRKPADEAWALGQAWRLLYPALVRVVSQGGLSPDSWPFFRRIAAEMERIAFGPPAENIGRLLALINQGIVDYSFLVGWEPRRQSGRLLLVPEIGDGLEVDLLVDATIPGPQQTQHGGMLDRLANDLSIRSATGGLSIGRAGRLLRTDKNPVPGLAIFGRVSEPYILGNDTLSRTLHSEMDQWIGQVREHLRAATEPTQIALP